MVITTLLLEMRFEFKQPKMGRNSRVPVMWERQRKFQVGNFECDSGAGPTLRFACAVLRPHGHRSAGCAAGGLGGGICVEVRRQQRPRRAAGRLNCRAYGESFCAQFVQKLCLCWAQYMGAARLCDGRRSSVKNVGKVTAEYAVTI